MPAREDNLECGILIRGGPHPRAIRDHITGLHAAGSLRRLLWEKAQTCCMLEATPDVNGMEPPS